MSELTISHLTEAVQVEGIKSEKRDNKQISELATLNKSFSQYFKSMAADKLDKLEEKREAVSGKAPTGQEMSSALQGAKDAMGFGLIGFLGAVGAALSGLAIGLTQGFGKYLGAIAKMFDILTGERISKGITTASKAIRTGLYRMVGLTPDGKLGPNLSKLMGMKNNAILRIRTAMSGISRSIYAMVGLGVDGKPVVGTSNFMKRMYKIGNMFKGGLNNIANAFRPLTTLIGGNAREIGGMFSKVGDGIKSFLNSFKLIGQTFQSLKGALTPIFTVFKTLGRVIFAPLTLILSIVDGIKGAIKGYQEQGILGGILGAVGGVLSGLIGMPLDLLKSAIGWIAGKLGFENFAEMLEGFSFADGIQDIFIKIADVFNNAISFITDSVGAIGKKVANFFGFGGDEEEEPETKTITNGRVQRLKNRQQQLTSDPSQRKAQQMAQDAKANARQLEESGYVPIKDRSPEDKKKFFDREQRELEAKLKFRREQLAGMSEAERKADSQRFSGSAADRITDLQKQLEENNRDRQAFNVPPMIAQTNNTTNNSQSNAMVGDGAPATDDLDRVA